MIAQECAKIKSFYKKVGFYADFIGFLSSATTSCVLIFSFIYML